MHGQQNIKKKKKVFVMSLPSVDLQLAKQIGVTSVAALFLCFCVLP